VKEASAGATGLFFGYFKKVNLSLPRLRKKKRLSKNAFLVHYIRGPPADLYFETKKDIMF
jgi:hypothetical protein